MTISWQGFKLEVTTSGHIVSENSEPKKNREEFYSEESDDPSVWTLSDLNAGQC